MTTEPLPEATRHILERFHAERVPTERLRERLLRDPDPEAMHRITEPVEPPPESAVSALPDEDSAAYAALRDEGRAMLERGELAVVVLAGGMATRFGSQVKALAPVLESHPTWRFLDLKLRDLDRAASKAPDTTLLTSFATHDALGEALGKDHWAHRAPQFVATRYTPKGELFLGADGAPSLYAPGHGDLPDALALAGALDRYRALGVKTVLMMNVDNVGATVDPALFAQHRASGARITVELVDKRPGDKGGLPVQRASGELVLAEAFRLPPSFPHERFGLFNTNTLWLDVETLSGAHDWTWCLARKNVDGREAVQFERLVGELTWWSPTSYVRVPREGARSRFIPVKDHAELSRSQEQILAVCKARLGLTL